MWWCALVGEASHFDGTLELYARPLGYGGGDDGLVQNFHSGWIMDKERTQTHKPVKVGSDAPKTTQLKRETARAAYAGRRETEVAQSAPAAMT